MAEALQLQNCIWMVTDDSDRCNRMCVVDSMYCEKHHSIMKLYDISFSAKSKGCCWIVNDAICGKECEKSNQAYCKEHINIPDKHRTFMVHLTEAKKRC